MMNQHAASSRHGAWKLLNILCGAALFVRISPPMGSSPPRFESHFESLPPAGARSAQGSAQVLSGTGASGHGRGYMRTSRKRKGRRSTFKLQIAPMQLGQAFLWISGAGPSYAGTGTDLNSAIQRKRA
eukprot:scaffold21254_cov14-Tisochrysis_lutea.AAC.1